MVFLKGKTKKIGMFERSQDPKLQRGQKEDTGVKEGHVVFGEGNGNLL